jgi:hypothetical protein
MNLIEDIVITVLLVFFTIVLALMAASFRCSGCPPRCWGGRRSASGGTDMDGVPLSDNDFQVHLRPPRDRSGDAQS